MKHTASIFSNVFIVTDDIQFIPLNTIFGQNSHPVKSG